MTAQQVLARVLAAGGKIVPDPARPRLLVPPHLRPLVTEHREALRQLVLEQGQPTAPSPLRLDAVTVQEVLGSTPHPEALQTVQAEVQAALARLENEVRTGHLTRTPILIRGVPLALWLPLEDVAQLLREISRQQWNGPTPRGRHAT